MSTARNNTVFSDEDIALMQASQIMVHGLGPDEMQGVSYLSEATLPAPALLSEPPLGNWPGPMPRHAIEQSGIFVNIPVHEYNIAAAFREFAVENEKLKQMIGHQAQVITTRNSEISQLQNQVEQLRTELAIREGSFSSLTGLQVQMIKVQQDEIRNLNAEIGRLQYFFLQLAEAQRANPQLKLPFFKGSKPAMAIQPATANASPTPETMSDDSSSSSTPSAAPNR